MISYDLLLSLITLTFLEIILGIDNLIFIALVVQKLPRGFRSTARSFGLSLAFIIRVLMLLTLSWVMTLNDPVFSIGNIDFSFKNILLICGGLFLIIKSSMEILEDVGFGFHSKDTKNVKVAKTMISAIMQISLIDFVFSFDSVITAIGMTSSIPVIVIAVMISMVLMFFASDSISHFLQKYPSLKIVALSFIFIVGAILLADGFHVHISKGYLYFALFFTLTVESINIVARKKH